MKLGYLVCPRGSVLTAIGDRVTCKECGHSASRAEALLTILSFNDCDGVVIDESSIHVDDKKRLVFFYDQTETKVSQSVDLSLSSRKEIA